MSDNQDYQFTKPLDTELADLPTLLLIDDSAMIRQQVKDILKQYALHIVEASDGEEGWEQFLRNPQTKLILCDINMPRLDGLGFLRRISAETGRPQVPIVMLTTENQLDKVMIGKKNGASAWLLKPPSETDVIRLVQKFTVPSKKTV
jgi:two-component system chemotaxis response regulator CheY